MRGFTSLALVGAFGTLFGVAGHAADMAFPPLEGTPVTEQPIALGTGWYLRGDVAWSRYKAPLLSSDLTFTSDPGLRNGYSFDLGFGYKFNNWLRSDVTFGYDTKEYANYTGQGNVHCPYGLAGYTLGTTEVGYLYNTNDLCTPKQQASLSRTEILLNGYVDLGTWAGITPYVGAGAGVVRTRATGTFKYYENVNGSDYNANLTPTGTYPPVWVDNTGQAISPQPPFTFTQQNWDQSFNKISYHFAWALMAGFAVDVNDHLKIDLGYRYVNYGSFIGVTSPANGSQPIKQTESSQEVRVGFRYMAD